MFFYEELLYLSVVIAVINSFQPNCDFTNQFERFCLPVQYCNDLECTLSKCGRFTLDSKIVRIKGSRIIPQCAFSNATNLKHIHGVDRQIQVLASGSFVNLPKLDTIDLSFNHIRELHHEIFKNVTVSSLDLSWNKIIYISEGAFSDLNGLKYLNLSRNELTTLPIKHLPLSIVDLNLSHNNLNRIALNAATRPDLVDVDLSYNALEHVALSFNNIVSKLDLSHNRLKDIDFFDVFACVELRIPGNLFSEIPDFLKYSHIMNVDLYPNPWKCTDLEELWKLLQNNLVNIVTSNPSDREKQNTPICAANSSNLSEVSARLINLKTCEDDTQCEDSMVCRARSCWDPCKTNICGETKVCSVISHRVECKCREKLKEDPKEIYSPCYDVQCTLNEHCPEGYCRYDKTCTKGPVGFTSSAASAQYSSGSQYSTPQFPGSYFGQSTPSAGYYTFGYSAPAQAFSRPGIPNSPPGQYFDSRYSAPVPFSVPVPEYPEYIIYRRYPSQSYQQNLPRDYYNTRYPTSQGYSGQRYSGQRYSGQEYSSQGYSGQGYSGQGYSGQGSGNREYYNPTYPGGQGYSSGAYAAPVATYSGTNVYSTERPSTQMKPWWFDDIPKEVPNNRTDKMCILNKDCPEGICHSNKTCIKYPLVPFSIGGPASNAPSVPIANPPPLVIGARPALITPPAPITPPPPPTPPAPITPPPPTTPPAPTTPPTSFARPFSQYSSSEFEVSAQGYVSPNTPSDRQDSRQPPVYPIAGFAPDPAEYSSSQGISGQPGRKGYVSEQEGISGSGFAAAPAQAFSSSQLDITSDSVSSSTPTSNNTAEVPWWYNDIPKVVPSTKKQS